MSSLGWMLYVCYAKEGIVKDGGGSYSSKCVNSYSFSESKNSIGRIKQGWHVAVAYILSFFVSLAAVGWRP